jgi:hypothetical protein
MSDNYYMDGTVCPTDDAVQLVLGEKFAWYEAILDLCDDFEQQWKHYGKKYGWKLKVHDGAKTLLELTVDSACFRIGMAVRERELKVLRANPETAAKLGELLDADKFAEGWGIRLTIDDAKRFEQAKALVAAIATMRSGE